MQHQSAPFIAKNETANLQEAFQDFSNVSLQLSEVYSHLEQQVTALNHELTSVRDARAQETAEKVQLASRLQNLLDVMPAGVIVLDKEGRITEANPAANGLFGNDISGKRWLDIVKESFSPQLDDGHDVTLKDKRCVNISTQALQGEAGQLILVKEVTETKRLQQQLDRLKRLSTMGDMASSLAHQIRTPLSTALLYASHLSKSDLTITKQQSYANKLVSRLQHLESLIEQMLLFARGGSLDMEKVAADDLLQAFSESIESKIETENINFKINNEVNNSLLNINKTALISIFQNLFENAVNAANGNVAINISAEQCDENNILFKFKDDGPGIASSVQEKIFEPFYTTREEGTGLGLSVAEAVIRAHNGQIGIDHQHQPGTCFDILLPVIKSIELES